MDVSELKKLLRSDERYQRIKRSFDKAEIYQLDREVLLEEMRDIQAIRVSSKLNTLDPDMVKQVIDNSARDQYNRSRISEIKMTAFRAKFALEKTLRSLHKYMASEYYEEISEVFRTQSERKQILDLIFIRMRQFIDDMNHVMEQADILLVDIDKNAWGLKLIIDALAIHAQKEHVI